MKVTGERPFNPGVCRHQLRFFRPQKSKNAIGGDVVTPILVCSVRGQVRELFGAELERAMARYAKARFQVDIPYFANCNRELILKWETDRGERTLDVLDVRDTAGTRARLELICSDPLAQ